MIAKMLFLEKQLSELNNQIKYSNQYSRIYEYRKSKILKKLAIVYYSVNKLMKHEN
jgi:hypothetical protein